MGATQTKPPPAPRGPEPETETSRRIDPPLAALVPLVGFLVLLSLSVVFDRTRGDVPAAGSLTVFAIAVVACSAVATPPVSVLLTICAWLDYDGFVIGHEGTLSWHGRADLLRISVLAGSALAILALRRLAHRRGTGGPLR